MSSNDHEGRLNEMFKDVSHGEIGKMTVFWSPLHASLEVIHTGSGFTEEHQMAHQHTLPQ